MSEESHADYFPAEAFPEDSDDFLTPENQSYWKNHYILVKQLHAARIEILGSDRYLSIDEEVELADQIQAGVLAREDAKEFGGSYDGRYDSTIEAGNDAQTALVIANLPFAAFFARASVGKVPDDLEDTPIPALPGDARSYVGTYSNVRNLANPRADIDDRTQTAMEAMWSAAEKFRPKTAKFSTFAAWYMQSALQRSSASEVGGWYLADHTLQQYRDAISHLSVYGILPAISHQGADGNRWAGFHPNIVFEGRKGVSYEEAGHWIAPEEEHPSFSDETSKLTLADVVPDNNGDIYAIDDEIARLVLREMLDEMLDQIPDRYSTVISMRYGLDDRAEKSLAQIGRVVGASRETVRQLEIKAMKTLRHPSRSSTIRTFLTDTSDNHIIGSVLFANVDGVGQVKTRHIEVSRYPSVENDEIDDELIERVDSDTMQPWQAYPGEDWDEDIRSAAKL